ncbi:MAG: hypothetical protein Harvfovirus2_3 [Harvfovirus sp.]|uniref:Ankyrin repeat protein n=1 Tax=Harvfovirus sp. TaxID=2487768 RepID=A0A3G5A3R5_9VIRU|nr:MAG: hypothetical protein Harvfovirus2_3 [Harvfovirus sp.]
MEKKFKHACIRKNLKKVLELMPNVKFEQIDFNPIQTLGALMFDREELHIKILEMLIERKVKITSPEKIVSTIKYHRMDSYSKISQYQIHLKNFYEIIYRSGTNMNFIFKINQFQCTFLSYLCATHPFIAKKFIRDKTIDFDLEYSGRLAFTPLFFCVKWGYWDIAKLLINEGANKKKVNLLIFGSGGTNTFAEELIAGDEFKFDAIGEAFFGIAGRRNSCYALFTRLENMINSDKEINKMEMIKFRQDGFRFTFTDIPAPLDINMRFLRACYNYNLPSVKKMLEHCAMKFDINSLHNGHNAISSLGFPKPGLVIQHLEIIKLIVSRGCDINNGNGKFAPLVYILKNPLVMTDYKFKLSKVMYDRYLEEIFFLVDKLMSLGADLFSSSSDGLCPMYFLLKYKTPLLLPFVKKLRLPPCLNISKNSNVSLIVYAMQNNLVDLVEYFLTKASDDHLRSIIANITPLHEEFMKEAVLSRTPPFDNNPIVSYCSFETFVNGKNLITLASSVYDETNALSVYHEFENRNLYKDLFAYDKNNDSILETALVLDQVRLLERIRGTIKKFIKTAMEVTFSSKYLDWNVLDCISQYII